MPSRQEYNACVSTFLKGKQLTRPERKKEFCVAAKICSGKAGDRDMAAELCAAKSTGKQETISCEKRVQRAVTGLAQAKEMIRKGANEGLGDLMKQVIGDIGGCISDEAIVILAQAAGDEAKSITGRFYLKGEGKDTIRQIELLEGALNEGISLNHQ